jgi:hypothetical protein
MAWGGPARTIKRCPADYYARKNISYLVAMTSYAPVIIEADH